MDQTMNINQQGKKPRGRPKVLTNEEAKNNKKIAMAKYMKKLQEAYKISKQITN